MVVRLEVMEKTTLVVQTLVWLVSEVQGDERVLASKFKAHHVTSDLSNYNIEAALMMLAAQLDDDEYACAARSLCLISGPTAAL